MSVMKNGPYALDGMVVHVWISARSGTYFTFDREGTGEKIALQQTQEGDWKYTINGKMFTAHLQHLPRGHPDAKTNE